MDNDITKSKEYYTTSGTNSSTFEGFNFREETSFYTNILTSSPTGDLEITNMFLNK